MEGQLCRRCPEDRSLTEAGKPDGRAVPAMPDAAWVRQRIRTERLRPYDNLESGPFAVGQALTTRLQSLIDEGFERFGRRISIAHPDFTVGDRPFHFLLHAWDPLAPFLHGLLPPTNPEGLAPAIAYAIAWLDAFDAPAQAKGADATLEGSRTGADEAWEGMATGMRAFRLAALVEAVARSDETDDAVLARLVDSLGFHFALLGRPGFFQSWSNHGLYQSLGLLSAGARFPWLAGGDRMADIARERLAELVAGHFDADGVHLEHSPTYHANLLGSLIGARNAGLLVGSAIERTLSGAEEALSWMVTPAGRLAAFGDSFPASVRQSLKGAARFRDPVLRYLTSDGAIGDPPASGVRLYKQSGYAFARALDSRLGEGPEQASYLAQVGAFHSRVHKHADHLAFLWSEGTTDILVEPGRYGYLGRVAPGDPEHDKGHWYADPRRMFVESTRAHNCVEVDGQSHQRKDAKPFGGALRQAEQFGDLIVFAGGAPLNEAVVQERVLILRPGAFLLVLDSLAAIDGSHDFRQWFQLDAAWMAQAVSHGYRARAGSRTLHITDLTAGAMIQPVRRAQTEPELQGWVSVRDGELTPASSLCLQRSGAAATLATLFSFGTAAVEDPAIGGDEPAGRTFAWTQDGVRLSIRLLGAAPRRMKAALTRQPA